MQNKLQISHSDLKNISGGFKYFIALDGSHVFIAENENERTVVKNEEAFAIGVFNEIKREGYYITPAEIFNIILEECGFTNTSFNSNSLLKLLTC